MCGLEFKSAGSCKTDFSPLSRVRHQSSLCVLPVGKLRGMSTADKTQKSSPRPHQNTPPGIPSDCLSVYTQLGGERGAYGQVWLAW